MVLTKDWLLRIGLFAALVVLAGLGIYAIHRYSQHKTAEQTLQDQVSQARHTASELEVLLNRLTIGIDTIIRNSQLDPGRTVDPKPLELLAANYPPGLLLGAVLQDSEGNILAEYPANWLGESGLPVDLLGEFSADLNGPRLIPGRYGPALQLSQRLPDAGRMTQISVLVSCQALQQLVYEAQSENSFMFLLDSSGQVLFHPDSELIGLDFSAVVKLGRGNDLHDLMVSILRGGTGSLVVPEKLLGAFDPHPQDRQLALSFVPVNVGGGTWRLAIGSPLVSLETLGKTQLAVIILLLAGLAGTGVILLGLFRQLAESGTRHNRETQLKNDLSQLQKQLALANLRNQQLLDNAGDALFFVDPTQGTILDQNQVCENLLGYTGAEITRLSLSVLFPGSQRRKYLRLMKRVLDTGYGEESELQFRTKKGHFFTGEVHARLGSLDDRQVVHGVIRDVTRLKRIEQELRQRNRDLTLINEIAFKTADSSSLNEALATVRALVIEAFSADGGGIYLSRHRGNLLELVTHDGIQGDTLNELKTLPPGQGLIGRVLASGRPVSSANLKNDSRVWSEAVRKSDWQVLQSVPLGSTGQPIGVLFVFHRQKRIYSRDEIRLLQLIARQVGATIAAADLLEELTWQNRLTKATNRELQLSRKLLSENLNRQKEATRTLERTEKMKNHFLSLASHELRTPLTYILSGSQFLLEEMQGTFSDDQHKLLQAVHQGGKRLEEIVNNLLEIARLEAQSIYLGKDSIDLGVLLQELRQTLQPSLVNNQLDLLVKPMPAHEPLQGDHDHLARALRRILENAIKFTPPGGEISLSAKRLTRVQVIEQRERLQQFRDQFFQQELAPAYLQLTVADTGIGIDPEEHLHIFDKFYEVGESHSHFTSKTRFGGKGVGLGLALVKGMIEAHNGVVWVESAGTKVGGSAFHLLLPLAAPATQPAAMLLPESDTVA
jgi:PAS domain S-box-containing protein